MPVIHDFGAFRISIYFHDHNPPHVHVDGTDFNAQVKIADATILVGDIPPRHREEALRWIAAQRAFLTAKWNEFQE